MAIFKQTFEPKLIYVYRINDSAHKGILKVGEASCDDPDYFALAPNSKPLNEAAKKRIRGQTQTAGITFDLLYTEKTAYLKNRELVVFQDHEVHDILERSGIKHKYFDEEHKANEWFYTDLETVKKAIQAAKEGRKSLSAGEITTDKNPIIFRPEQREAIDMTIKKFHKKSGSHQMLWNAKMRFGKTLSALQVIKECDMRRTLILTHRPVVDEGWFEDYGKIFYDRPEFLYGSKSRGSSLEDCERIYKTTKTGSYIYFASIQDMRGSEAVGGKFAKNEDVFSIDWDLIIIDEAHEGTQTELGQKVLSACTKSETRVLNLSGTPFNLLDDFRQDEIYTWDYVMEQKAKRDWDILHKGDPNPYACLPRLNIFTYDLGKLYPEYADADIAFNFHEFFRVDEEEKFVHEANIKQFLDLLVKKDKDSNYPYSTQEYRENFRHSLWMVPGVKAAKALSKLLQQHPVFRNFNIANVAGAGDEEVPSDNALKLVDKAIGKHPEESFSITLSCGRLTTGVSVKPWTACFMLAGTYSTAASSYMQTIFRVQTPAIIGGKQKEECYVFDFAPDRTLKVVAETAKISAKAGHTTSDDRKILSNFLNFCPIIGFDGSHMKAFDTEKMLGQLKKAYVERVVRNGFEDGYLYNEDLMKLNAIELKEFENLKEIIGTTKAMAKTNDIDINKLGLTDEEYEEINKPQPKKRDLTPEEEERRKKRQEAKKNRDAAISILRGISIRMPLLIYGADLNKNLDGTEEIITIDNFADIVDDLSWKEFMPAGVTKDLFKKFKKYYDEDVFRESGIRIREMTKAADKLRIEERIERIGAIFNTFRNPDKETVLTPWRVVNMHMADTLGGWRFYDKEYKENISEPIFVNHDNITNNVFKKNAHILEINSKSGLYALYCAYSIYKTRFFRELKTNPTPNMEQNLWERVLKENIFIICKTPMAKSIAKRTLAGFLNIRVNSHHFEDLINQITNKPDSFIKKICKPNTWNQEGNDMKFDAIVGNPPYQLTVAKKDTENGQKRVSSIFHYFQIIADRMCPLYTSLIYPGGRWIHRSGKGLAEFGLSQINDKHLSLLEFFSDANYIFNDAGIADGISIVLKDFSKETAGFKYIYDLQPAIIVQNPKDDLMPLNPNEFPIVEKIKLNVKKNNFNYLHDSILSQKLFSIESDFVEKNPTLIRKYTDGDLFNHKNEIKLLTNDKAGKSGRAQWYIAPRNVITTGEEYLNRWKVVVSSANAGGQKRNNQIAILDNYSAFGRARVALKTFKTQKEAQNFYLYATSDLIKFTFLLTDESLTSLAKLVPDIISYNDNNGIINFDKNIDSQLFNIFEINHEEQMYIKQVLQNKNQKQN